MTPYKIVELCFDTWDEENNGVVTSAPIVAVLKTHQGNEHRWYVTCLVEAQEMFGEIPVDG